MMRHSKRQVREKKDGKKGGSTKDLLNLSSNEESYIEIRRRLALGLKARRQLHGITQVAMARSIKSSQSRVAKMESADPTVSLDLLFRSLLALGMSGRELAAIIAKQG